MMLFTVTLDDTNYPKPHHIIPHPCLFHITSFVSLMISS